MSLIQNIKGYAKKIISLNFQVSLLLNLKFLINIQDFLARPPVEILKVIERLQQILSLNCWKYSLFFFFFKYFY